MRINDEGAASIRLFLALLGAMAAGMGACYFGLWLPLITEVWPP